ncbi:hypothetical protein HY410_00815 [Candidatus Gottesmanbacteria bacterium]|nr:hypothetical protein [Candidatus Gottesmanbacteria bacterium]
MVEKLVAEPEEKTGSTLDWVRFEDVGKRWEKRITVTKGATIGFPTSFYKEKGISQYKFVLLYYSPQAKAIGIFFNNDASEKGKIKIAHSKQGYGAGINAKAFFRANAIDYVKYSGKYIWTKERFEDKELYVIKLKDFQAENSAVTENAEKVNL